MNRTEKMIFLIKEFVTAVEAQNHKTAWECLKALRTVHDEGEDCPTEVFAAMPPDLRVICFDSMLGVYANILKCAMR